MHINPKTASLLILGITALACSRMLFWFFHDPEGPNLLIVVVMAAVIYLVSFAAYRFIASAAELKKLVAAIAIQVIAAAVFYFVLRLL
ncbi:MAG TPA: hypothetical protein VF439_01765 [Candidatus Paceibacterota bacterium]